MTSTDLDRQAVRERLAARIAPGWPATLAVPEQWLPHLGRLDTQLAAIDPGYLIVQVKQKYGSLRYYLEDTTGVRLPCCERRASEHPQPASDDESDPRDEGDNEGADAWADAEAAHEQTAEHRIATRVRNDREEHMAVLIAHAERSSYHW